MPKPPQLEQQALPTGTITFLFTDIEGSTRLIQQLGAEYPGVLGAHRSLIESAVADHGGQVFGTEGDALFVAFDSAPAAVSAALAAQHALARSPWPEGHPMRVRMGIHTGDAALVGGDYVGLALHQVARITAAAHGGQVLVSASTRSLLPGAPDGGPLLRDLGIHRLKDLTEPERLYQLDDPDHPGPFPALRTLDARPNNLPVQLTSFIGRDELATARRLLGTTHLLTLTGPGGTGKTRLALQLAAEATDDFPDGVFFVALDSVTDPDLIPSAIVAAVGLESGTTPPIDRLLAWVRRLRVLLVLDNFEQVVEGAPLIASLLQEAPGLRLVVTSRIPLHAYGEQELPVPALNLPPGGDLSAEAAARSEAVLLFVERAMAIQPQFRLTDANATAVGEIVRRLDGLPLAIELAAARVRVLPIEAIRARLDRALSILVGGPRERPTRQQTLRGAIDWSHDLLDEPDRRLFARVGIFNGGASLDHAEAVCGPAAELGEEVLDGLSSLVDKSLVRTVPAASIDPSDAAEPRFAMLATIREYALERLASNDEGEAMARRHATAYLGLAEGCVLVLTGPDGRRWRERLELDHDNLRSAVEWAIASGEAEIALRLGAALWRFWQIQGHLSEAKERLDRILAMPAVADQTPLLRAAAEGAAGSIAYWQADFPETHRHYAAALELARASADQRAIAEATYNIAFVPRETTAVYMTDAGESAAILLEALALYRALGDDRGQANSLWALAISSLSQRDSVAGRMYLEQSLERYGRLGDQFGLGWALHMLGLVDLFERKLEGAEARFREALRIFQSSADRAGIVVLFADLAALARATGEVERGWILAGACDDLRIATGVGVVLAAIEIVDWTLPERPHDDPDAERAWDAGRRLTVDEAVAYALREPGSGPGPREAS